MGPSPIMNLENLIRQRDNSPGRLADE